MEICGGNIEICGKLHGSHYELLCKNSRASKVILCILFLSLIVLDSRRVGLRGPGFKSAVHFIHRGICDRWLF